MNLSIRPGRIPPQSTDGTPIATTTIVATDIANANAFIAPDAALADSVYASGNNLPGFRHHQTGPSPCFRCFRADTLFLVAGFDVFRLTLLFVSITGFIALRHGCALLVSVIFDHSAFHGEADFDGHCQ